MKKKSHFAKHLLAALLLTSSLLASAAQARTRPVAKPAARQDVTDTTATATQAGQIGGTRRSAVRTAVVRLDELARQEALEPTGGATVDELSEFIPPRNIMPREMPVPEDAEAVVDKTMAHASSAAATMQAEAASPAPAASFAAFSFTGSYPPDTHGAVGVNYLVTVLNGRMGVQDKSGAVLTSVSQRTFWSALGANTPNDIFDPKVLYDPYNQRFIMTSCATRRSAESSVLIAVSQTSDPRGAWNMYRIDADAANESWADFPSIGFNKKWIVVHMNMFDNDPDNPPVVPFQSRLWVFDKANLYAAGNGAYTEIKMPDVGSTIVPAVTLDPNLETLYLLQNWNGNSGGLGYLRVYSITGTAQSPVLNNGTSTTGRFISTPAPWSSSAPSVNGSTDFMPQLGATQKVQANDSRMHSVVYRNGSLWGAHTVFLPAGGVTRSAIQWWQFEPVSLSVQQRGRIDDASGNTFFAFPSIAVNKNNDVLVGYSRFRASEYGSAAYSFRAAADPANTLRDDALLKTGEDAYARIFEERNRWGDYSATVVDPADDTSMWTIQEYAVPRNTSVTDPNTAGRWGTWWGRINPPGTTTPEPRDTTVQFAVSNLSVNEATGSASVTVTRTGQTSVASDVSYSTSNGTASDASDYMAAFGTLSFAVNETTKTFPLFIVNDGYAEANETLTVTLGSPNSATIGAASTLSVTIVNDDVANTPSPVRGATFNPQFFVRQHYLDFFNREPDAPGLAFWVGQTTNCGNADLQVCRDNVSAAFFVSTEFQQTGYFVYKMYQAAYGSRVRASDPTVPLTLREFLPDTQAIGRGIIVGQGNWQQQLEQNKQSFIDDFVTRQLFLQKYPLTMSNEQFVDTLNQNTRDAGHATGALTQTQRNNVVAALNGGQLTRAQAVRAVAENDEFGRRQYNRAFVLMQYFGYLRRNPYDAPEFNLDFGGYNFWLNKLNEFGGNYITSQMVRAFITSGEYEKRFGQ